MDKDFIADFQSITDQETYYAFYGKYKDKYPIIDATQANELQPFIKFDENYVKIPRRYFCIKDNKDAWQTYIVKVRKGEREKTLFKNALLRLKITPEMTLEHLIFCLAWERQYYFDNSDGELTNYTVKKVARGAFNNKNNYNVSLNCKQLKKRAKNKSGYIVNPAFCESQGLSARSVANHIRSMKSNEVLREHYDYSKTVKQNHHELSEKGIKPNSERRLYQFIKENSVNKNVK